MNINLCILTADLLPLYAEDLLSPETRQMLAEHAAGCPTCAERLRTAASGLALPPSPPPPTPAAGGLDQPARRFFGRLRRILFYATVLTVIGLVAMGSVAYQLGRRSVWSEEATPGRVAGSDELARRVVPGWARAEEQGLIVPLGITERVRETEAAITFEKAWYTGRNVYILYSVRAPEGEHVVPTWAFLFPNGDEQAQASDGATDWAHLDQWGGFSREGFHSVMVFSRLNPVPGMERLQLQIRQWVAVTPGDGADPTANRGRELNVNLPWRPEYLREPSPEVLTLAEQRTWLGRTLALERAEVGTGQVRLFGWIELPAGERNPGLAASLLVGGESRPLKEYRTEPANEPNRYRFTATFDGPGQWPAPLQLELGGIGFETDQVLEWLINWARYRQEHYADERLMDPEDRTAITYYDSTLTTVWAHAEAVSVEVTEPSIPVPYVRAALACCGRGPRGDHPGFELVSPGGEAWTNMGGGGGNITPDGRQGLSVRWGDDLPASFRQADRLTLRYVSPGATLVLKETWDLTK